MCMHMVIIFSIHHYHQCYTSQLPPQGSWKILSTFKWLKPIAHSRLVASMLFHNQSGPVKFEVIYYCQLICTLSDLKCRMEKVTWKIEWALETDLTDFPCLTFFQDVCRHTSVCFPCPLCIWFGVGCNTVFKSVVTIPTPVRYFIPNCCRMVGWDWFRMIEMHHI